MANSQMIVHHLSCDGENPANLTLSDQLLTDDSRKDQLLDKLKGSFLGRLTRRHGSFSSEVEVGLPVELEGYLADKNSLTELSRHFTEQLAKQLEQRKLPLNAHFLFFIEKSFDHHHIFYLFVTHQNESLAISDKLQVCPSYVIDTGASMFGIKVDLAEWKGDRQYAYLSQIPPKGDGQLAELFDELTGFNHGIDKQQATSQLLEGVESFAKQLPQEQAKEVRSQVVEFCMDREQNDLPVNIPDLSQALQGVDSEQFVRQFKDYAPESQEEPVMIDRRALQRYVKFAGREKELAVSFSSHQLGERVRYDESSDTLSIHGLPKSLRDQLLRHLKG